MTEHTTLDPQWLENAYLALERAGLDPQAVVVAQSGKPVASASWEPYRLEEPALVYSVSKTFSAAAIGFAVAEGLVSLQAPAWTYLLESEPAGPRARRITVHHLLTMDTGHTEEQINAVGPPYDLAALLTTEPQHEPGTWFDYNSCASFLLSAIIQRVSGQRLTEYLRPRLLDPLGFGQRWWRPNGEYDQGYSGFHITVGEIAAMAGAYLGWGAEADGNPLPAGWGALSAQGYADTSNHDSTADNILGYGYQVWRSQYGFRLDGAYGQWGLIIPELDLVIGYRGGTHRTAQVLQIWWDEVITKLLAAGAGQFPDSPTDRSHTHAVSAAHLSLPAPLHSARVAPIRLEVPGGVELPASPPAAAIVPAPHELALKAGSPAVVRLGSYEFPVTGQWTPHEFEEGQDRVLPLAAAGTFLPDGGWRGAVFATSSCHRMELHAPAVDVESEGVFPLEVQWVTEPLGNPRLEGLAVAQM